MSWWTSGSRMPPGPGIHLWSMLDVSGPSTPAQSSEPSSGSQSTGCLFLHSCEVVSALCAIGGNSDALPRTDMLIDPSKIKVSIEYGISEIFNGMSIKTPPKDGEWGFNLPELELKFPAGTLDPEFEPVVKELPKWGETSSDAYARFGPVIHALADRYPSENLLFITHGAGLRATAWTFLNGAEVHKVEYCAYVELERQINMNDSNSFIAGKFGVVSHHGY
ncbi:uncharacterized protein LOC116202225 [Punica granatum]|uniref:Uncharacterized protein LOC116202225 n=1 Tax=Punica granatum TaxID=22663 RepID=A0A6P8CXQ1_PUNGR|nr:uncharacterized protein LOC116202225 [Punica granatum]